VGIEHAGLVELCPVYYYPSRFPLFHPQEKIRVYLVLGPTTAITFRVCHGPVYYEVFFLYPGPIITEAIMKLGFVFLVTIESCAVDGVGGIQAHAALETAASHGPAVTLHFYFFNKVFDALMQMSEAVNLIVTQVRNSPKHFSALRPVGSVICESYCLP
jgi:hypothetical protein